VPGSTDFACGTGLTCADCTYADKGFRCLGPNGCCKNDRIDSVQCGDFQSGKHCCDWQCVDEDDPEHCGFCGNDCSKTPLPGYEGCFSPAQCTPRSGDFLPRCEFEPQCPADTECVPSDILVITEACMPAPNGQGSICCFEPVTPLIEYADLPGGGKEGEFKPIDLNRGGAECTVESSGEDCPGDGEICKFNCSRVERMVGGCHSGICVVTNTTTTTTTLPPCVPEFGGCKFSSECCDFGIGFRCQALGLGSGICVNPFD